MSKKIYSPEELNTAIRKIEERGFTPYSQSYSLQSSFPNIIIDNALPRAGQLRTYEETRAFLKMVTPRTFEKFTREQYEAQIIQINKQLGKRRTLRGELLYQRKRLNDIIYDMNESQETYFNPKDFSIDELYKAVKNAAKKSKENQGNYTSFYSYLEEELEEMR